MWKKKLSDCEDGFGNEDFVESNPTKKYVNILLLGMFQNGTLNHKLTESEPLPTIPLLKSDVEIPTFEHVMNRLKVMSQLDPIRYPLPQQGKIELSIGGKDQQDHRCIVHTTFNDCAADRTVELRLEIADESK